MLHRNSFIPSNFSLERVGKTILKVSLLIASLAPLSVHAQDIMRTDWKFIDDNTFKHLDISVTGGTTGIGIDVAAPVNDYLRLRVGGTFMPYFEKKMNFGVEVGEDPSKSDERFRKLSEMLEGFTGYKVSKSIDMLGTPNMSNFKFLVDVYPFKSKKFHVTAGFYLGGSNIAKAVNTQEGMNSLVATAMYNSMYKKAAGNMPLMEYKGQGIHVPEINQKFLEWGMMSIPLGEVNGQVVAQEDIYWDFYAEDRDPNSDYYLEPIHNKGDIRYHKGDVIYNDGDTYRMTPDEDNMVRANAKVNAFKPYLGFGYSTAISNDKRTTLTVDAGALFWGGTPSIITRTPVGIHADGSMAYAEVDMCRDLRNVRGKAGDYVDLIKKFPVYPILNISITQRLF